MFRKKQRVSRAKKSLVGDREEEKEETKMEATCHLQERAFSSRELLEVRLQGVEGVEGAGSCS